MTTDAAATAGTTAGTLASVLELPALSGARVLGPLDATRPVGALALADDDAPSEPDHILLTAGAPPSASPAGCAAVVCRIAPDRQPTEVPVIVLPPGAPWGPVLAQLALAVLPSPGEVAGARGHQAFRRVLIEGGGFDRLALEAAELLGGPVLIVDDYLDRLGESGLDDGLDERVAAAVERARGHTPASVLLPFVEDELPSAVREPVTTPDGPCGAIVAFIDAPRTAGQAAILAALCEAVLLERSRETVRAETEARLRGDLIEELTAGEPIGPESVVRRARHLGANLAPGAFAVVGMLNDPHDEGRVISDARLIRRFVQQARATIDLHWPGALVDWRDGRLTALAPPPAAPEPGEEAEVTERAEALGRRLLVATRETVPGLVLTLGLSRFTAEPDRLGAAIEEARLALTIGSRLGRAGEVITFEETGTYRLLFQLFADRPSDLRDFYTATMEPLVRYDEQYQTELVGTLSTYLGNDANLALTAGELFTHRHTIRYRLDRIAELSGLDVGRTDDREKLSLGLKAMRLLGVRIPAPAERPARGRRPRIP